MKTFKAMCAATVLALSLNTPAFADGNPGEGHSPGRTNSVSIDFELPPPTGDSGDVGTSDDGLVTMADILWALASIY